MWIPGLFLGTAAIVVAVVIMLNADRVSRRFKRGSALIGDKNPDRYTPENLKGPSVMGIGIGIAILLISVFGRPIP